MDGGAEKICEKLKSLADEQYAAFCRKLTPTAKDFSGVRLPHIRRIIKEILNGNYGDPLEIYEKMPNGTIEEIYIKGGVIAGLKDVSESARVKYVAEFIGGVDNWANCDNFAALSKFIPKNREFYLPFLTECVSGGGEFVIRYGIITLMSYFLTDEYVDFVLQKWSEITCGAFYVQTALAWGYATALAKYYDNAKAYLTDRKLGITVHNKTLRKAVESFRISPERKAELKLLRIKRG